MHRVTEHLYRSDVEHPFDNDVKTCAYLLRRQAGNVLLYSSGTLRADEKHLRELGGVERQLLNHRDEASAHCDWVRESLGAPLTCHAEEAGAVAEQCTVDETFDGEDWLFDDLLAIPTPGHCPGSTCYLWQAPDGNYLFTGDTLYLSGGEWRVFVRLGTNEEMIESLGRLAALDVDVVVPGLFIGNTPHLAVTAETLRQQLDDVIERLSSGEKH